MQKKPGFSNLQKRRVNNAFDALKKETDRLYKEETDMIEELFRSEENKRISRSVAKPYLESCSNIFVEIMKKQNEIDIEYQKLFSEIDFLDQGIFTDYYVVNRSIGQRFKKAYGAFCSRLNG